MTKKHVRIAIAERGLDPTKPHKLDARGRLDGLTPEQIEVQRQHALEVEKKREADRQARAAAARKRQEEIAAKKAEQARKMREAKAAKDAKKPAEQKPDETKAQLGLKENAPKSRARQKQSPKKKSH